MEVKDFQKEYEEKGAYHHNLLGFKELWFNRNYSLLSKDTEGKILDIACGDGRMVDFLDTYELVDGFDISEKAIELARSKQIYRDLWKADIMENHSYWRNSYDFFICSLSLQYITKNQLIKHFNFMQEVLSQGGEYRFSFPNISEEYSPEFMKRLLRPYFKHIIMQTITGFIPKAGQLNLEELKDAFSKVKDCPIEKSYHYMVSVRVR